MAVTIRLRRMGSKKRVFYRLVAIDKRKRREGRVLEELGWYNPVVSPKTSSVNKERVAYWRTVGAEISTGATALLTLEGIIEKPKIKYDQAGKKRRNTEKLTKAEKRKQAEVMLNEADAKSPSETTESENAPETEAVPVAETIAEGDKAESNKVAEPAADAVAAKSESDSTSE